MTAPNGPAIGIDLGTTYSCVGVWQTDHVEIIPNHQGNRKTPSFVSFNASERLVGDDAKNQVSMNLNNTVSDVKRFIGRRFSDPSVQSDLNHLSYTVIGNDGDKPFAQVEYNGQQNWFSPEEISAMILAKMKEDAESFLGKEVKNAVITVPAFFNESQRLATKDAGKRAGLNVLQIISEPTAAAIAYGLDWKGRKETFSEKNVLIVDLGGGTCDVSFLTIKDGIFEVKATARDSRLGGEDFDNQIVTHFLNKFKRENNMDISGSAELVRRLRTQCERAKMQLSSVTNASIEDDQSLEGFRFHTSITRATFEEICIDLFRGTLALVEKVLKDLKISKAEVDDIVLIGGSTRIPKVQSMLTDFFNGKELYTNINPDEVVAYGAAIQAAILNVATFEKTQDLLSQGVTPPSLDFETLGDVMKVQIKWNTTAPTKKKLRISRYADNQPGILIEVYEGERTRTKEHNILGKHELSEIPPAAHSAPQIEASFEIDATVCLSISSENKGTGKQTKIIIKNEKGRLAKEDAEKLVQDTETGKVVDVEKIETRNGLENYCYQLKDTVFGESTKAKISAEDKAFADKIDEVLARNDENLIAGKGTFDEKAKSVERTALQIMTETHRTRNVSVIPEMAPKLDETPFADPQIECDVFGLNEELRAWKCDDDDESNSASASYNDGFR